MFTLLNTVYSLTTKSLLLTTQWVMCKMETATMAFTDVTHDRHKLKQPTKVLLTLSNVLLPKEKLTSTPSMIDGLDFETEVDLRIVGCEWIQTAGILLKLPQVKLLALFCHRIYISIISYTYILLIYRLIYSLIYPIWFMNIIHFKNVRLLNILNVKINSSLSMHLCAPNHLLLFSNRL